MTPIRKKRVKILKSAYRKFLNIGSLSSNKKHMYDILLVEPYKFSYILCLIRSFPYLKYFEIQICSVLTLFFLLNYWLFIILFWYSKSESCLFLIFIRDFYEDETDMISKNYLNLKVCLTWHYMSAICFRFHFVS